MRFMSRSFFGDEPAVLLISVTGGLISCVTLPSGGRGDLWPGVALPAVEARDNGAEDDAEGGGVFSNALDGIMRHYITTKCEYMHSKCMVQAL